MNIPLLRKIWPLQRRKAPAPARSSAIAQITPSIPQGPLTRWFQDYVLRKTSGDFYEALREGIPVIDAAIRRLISLNGTIKIIGDNAALVHELEDFCLSVPVNDTQKGIHAYLENASNETFEQGFAVSEFILTKDLRDVASLRVADSKQIIFRRNAQGVAEMYYRNPSLTSPVVYSRPEQIVQTILTSTYNQTQYVSGVWETKLVPENKLYFSINNENTDPYGVSIMRSMEFVSKILMTMQNSIMNVWERFGDPSYHIKYKTTRRDLAGDDIEARRQKIATDFATAITAKRAGKSADFITAVNADADVTIEVIGHDNQVLQLDVPARHILEQMISKTGLPAWMLGIYWSTTERMATLEVEMCLQDAKVRTLAMTPEFMRLFSTLLSVRGRTWKSVTTDPKKPGDWGFYFETPNLHDLVAQAQARFLNAQADQMLAGAAKNGGTQTSVSVGGAAASTITVHTKTAQAIGIHRAMPHDHEHKEETRPVNWAELDKVETEYLGELVYDWHELEENIFRICDLEIPEEEEKGAKNVGVKAAFTFSDDQRKAAMKAYKDYLGIYEPTDANSPVRWYYGQAYSLGLIQAAHFVGEERPILDIIKNKEIFDELVRSGFDLVKENATRAITEEIIPAMEEGMAAGANPREVASRLHKLFGDQNSNWERLARSEMSMAAERAKLDEWAERDMRRVEFTPAPDACAICVALAGDYDIGRAPLPVRDTHPRCRCSTRPAASET